MRMRAPIRRRVSLRADFLEAIMGESSRKLRQEFQIARATAIEEYALLEHCLSILFAKLLGATPQKANVVFFRITNTFSRNKIFEALLAQTLGTKFLPFWFGKDHISGLLGLIRQLDSRRNEIIHWHLTTGGSAEIYLEPPNFWARKPETPTISVAELKAFAAKARFVNSLIMTFMKFALGLFSHSDDPGPWLEIFEQPIPYPPPENHLLAAVLKRVAPDNPPQSSD